MKKKRRAARRKIKIKLWTKTVRTAQASTQRRSYKSLEQHIKRGLEWRLREREGDATVLSRNNTRQRDGLNMLSRGTRGEQKTSQSGKENSDGIGYPPACSRPGMPRPYSPMGILGSSHRYVIRDPHPSPSEVRLQQLDQPPSTESQCSLKADGPPRWWTSTRSKKYGNSWK